MAKYVCPGCEYTYDEDAGDEGAIYHGSTTANGSGDWALTVDLTGPNITATAIGAGVALAESADSSAAPPKAKARTAVAPSQDRWLAKALTSDLLAQQAPAR